MPVLAWSHAMQTPVHALEQHVPRTQCSLRQSLSMEQPTPSASWPRQMLPVSQNAAVMQSEAPAQVDAQLLPLHWVYVPQLMSAGEVHKPAPSHTSCGVTTAAFASLPGTHEGPLPQVVPWAFGVQVVVLVATSQRSHSFAGLVVPSAAQVPPTRQPVVRTFEQLPPWHCRLVQESPSSVPLVQGVPLVTAMPHDPFAGLHSSLVHSLPSSLQLTNVPPHVPPVQ
jgi:hypothetical protein